MNRENVYNALFLRLDALRPTYLTTTGRYLPDATLSPPEGMPGGFQLQTGEKPLHYTNDNGVAVWEFYADWYIYGVGEQNVAITPAMNPILDQVLGLLDIDGAAGQLFVAGVAYGIRLNGMVEWFEGLIQGQCVIRVPVAVVVPTN